MPGWTPHYQGGALFLIISAQVKQTVPTLNPTRDSFTDNQTIGGEMNVYRCLPGGLWKMNSACKVPLLDLIS